MVRKKSSKSTDPRSSREARGKRLSSLRGITRLSREEFAEKNNFSKSNFQNWECPRFGGLTPSGARKILRGVKAEGVICSIGWLLHGIGPGPKITERSYLQNLSYKPAKKTITEEKEINRINDELLALRDHYGDLLDYEVEDDTMEPHYHKGEIVAGIRLRGTEIPQAINKESVVQLKDGEVLLCILQPGSRKNRYDLHFYNNAEKHREVSQNVEIASVAPVIFIRRKVLSN